MSLKSQNFRCARFFKPFKPIGLLLYSIRVYLLLFRAQVWYASAVGTTFCMHQRQTCLVVANGAFPAYAKLKCLVSHIEICGTVAELALPSHLNRQVVGSNLAIVTHFPEPSYN